MNLRSLISGSLVRPSAKRGTLRTPRLRSARRTAATAVLTAIAAYAALHTAILAASAVTHSIVDPVYADKERRLRRVEAEAPPGAPRVILLGTSRTGNAFAAGRVQSAARAAGTPAVVFNFGVPGAGPVLYEIYLRRLLADGHRPALLLVEVLPPLLADLPIGPYEAAISGDVLSRHEVGMAARAGVPPERLHRQWRDATLSPVYAHRFKLAGRLLPSVVPLKLRCDQGRTPDPNGWNAVPFEVTDEERASNAARMADRYRGFFGFDLPAGPAAAALRNLVALGRAEGIPTALVLLPEATTFRALYPAKVESQLKQFFAGLTAEFGCPVIDAREWLDDRCFLDSHHTLRHGAAAFTDRLAAEVILPFLRTGRNTP